MKARIHVTADERYDLYVDGLRVGRGSERGDAANWFYESYDLTLPAGRHTLVARVWTLGDKAPFAQITLRPGFLLAAEGDAGAPVATVTGRAGDLLLLLWRRLPPDFDGIVVAGDLAAAHQVFSTSLTP